MQNLNNKQIIKILRDIANNDIFPEGMEKCNGLCYLLSNTLDRYDLRKTLESVIHEWPLFSGVKYYPVSHPTLEPKEAYDCTWSDHMWDNSQYGKNRKDLCLWFADYIEQNFNLNVGVC